MIFTLKPVEDFVLERKEYWRNKSMEENGNEMYCRAKHSEDCEKYSEFVKRELKREMIIPMDENGNVMFEPVGFRIYLHDKETDYQSDVYQLTEEALEICKEYEKAYSNLLFEVDSDKFNHYLKGHNVKAILTLSNQSNEDYKTIKDLMWLEPVLTEKAKKEIGL